jgi:hypothetical protein
LRLRGAQKNAEAFMGQKVDNEMKMIRGMDSNFLWGRNQEKNWFCGKMVISLKIIRKFILAY